MKNLSTQRLLRSNVSTNIENVVATTSLNQKIDIRKIVGGWHLSQYDPKKFPGAIIRQKHPRSVLIVFKSGSLVCTGTKSQDMANYAIQKFVSDLKKSNNFAKLQSSTIKIQNMVASCNLGNKIHLEKAARNLPRSMYEPEQFPGIIHRLSYPNTVALIFASGRMVCTGAKSYQEIQISANTVLMELEKRNLVAYQT